MRHRLLAGYVVLCLLAQVWPVYPWLGNSFEPTILGLPFSLVWIICWVLATFLVLLAYLFTEPAVPQREH